MQTEKTPVITVETQVFASELLKRGVTLDIFYPAVNPNQAPLDLLVINDGQDLAVMNFQNILSELYLNNEIQPLLCVGISCGIDRRNEYGTAKFLDYKGRGNKAAQYTRFIFEELFPFLVNNYPMANLKRKSFCGFSMGGLSALDIVWNRPEEFEMVGIFSGSLWWRSVGQEDPLFDENKDRIMQYQIRNGGYYPWLKFFFETGTKDETADRNNNGIIDSIDDTISLINEMEKKGYVSGRDIRYLEMQDGSHDVATWGKAFPEFLKWGWGTSIDA